MLLSELKKELPNINILRDGEFSLTSKLGFSARNGVLSFVEDKRYINSLSSEISCVVTTEELSHLMSESFGVVVADNPRGVFGSIHNMTAKRQIRSFNPDIPFMTKIGSNCEIHKTAVIADNNVLIGDNVVIGANVVIQEFVTIGNDCVIYPGVVIGEAGFEYFKYEGKTQFFTHLGKVVIGNNVYIHPNSCVAKALFVDDSTTISDNVTISSLSEVSHGVKIGECSVLTAGSIIGGNVVINDNVYIGMNSAVKQLLNVGKNSIVGMGGVVIHNVEDNVVVAGNPVRILHS